MTLSQFFAQPAHWRVIADLGLLSLFVGLFSVPMYALIQLRSPASHRARIIAANNILNALFIIVSSLGAGLLLGAGFTHARGLPGHRRCSTRWWRPTSSCSCPSTCCASSPSC